MNMLTRELQLVATAVMFLTRIPMPNVAEHNDAHLQHSSRYFPLVGALVGAIAGSVILLMVHVLPAQICIALSMALTLLLTGAFHEDGWADACDAFGGGRDRDDILRIMQDSRVGAFGAIGIAMMLGIKFLALSAIPWGLLLPALIAGHALSRAAAVTTMYAGTYARASGGKTRPIAAGVPATDAGIALALGLLTQLLLPTAAILSAVVAAAIAFAAAALLYAYFRARLGGYTGDCLGAIQQLSEVVFYLAMVAAIGRVGLSA